MLGLLRFQERLTTGNSPFSNTANYDGKICKCTINKCNGNVASAEANTEYDENAGNNSKGIGSFQMVCLLLIAAFLQLMFV